MAVRAFELVGTVEVNTGKARSELKQFDDTVSRIDQKMQRGGLFGPLFKAGLAASGVASLTAELVQSGRAIVDYSSKLEQSKIAFTTLLGSADAASAHLKALQQFANKTPFQFDDLIDASRRLQAMGFSAKQVVPILTDVGNAVAAVGGSREVLDRVILALSQMQAKGRVATQEINQLAEAGIPAWKLLSEAIGQSRAETIKLAENGQISADVFLKAFQKFSQANFGGMMEKQSRTFAGAMSNIKDSLLQTASTAFEPLFEKISQISDRISQEMTNGKPTVEKSFQNLMGGLAEIATAAGEQIGETFINNIINGIKHPSESIPKLLRNAFAVPIGIFDAIKDQVLPEPSGDLTKPLPVTGPTPVPLPARALDAQQGALSATNTTAEKTADILNRVKEKLFSVGDASTYAATKQALLRAGVTDLNTGLAAQALKLAQAADAAQAFAEKQQAEADRIFQRGQDIGSQLQAVVSNAKDEVLDLAAAATGGRSEIDKFNQGLALTADVAGGFTEQIKAARAALENLDTAKANEKVRQQVEALLKMRQELSKSLSSMTRDFMRGDNSSSLDQLADRLMSISELKLQPGAFDSLVALFKAKGDAVELAEALAEVGTALAGVAGDIGPEKIEKVKAQLTNLFKLAAEKDKWAQLNEQTQKYRDLLTDLNQVLGTGVTFTERQRIEALLLTDAYKGLTEAQKNNLKLRASEADAHLKHLKEIDELHDQLGRLANDVANTFSRAEEAFIKTPGKFADKWKEAFREIGLGFADMLAQMANDLLRSAALRMLERAFGIDKEPGSESRRSFGSVNLLGAITDKILGKLGVKTSSSTVPATVGSSAAGKATDVAVQQTIKDSTDKVTNGQQSQTAAINTQISASADRIVDGLTPRQESFWKGLLTTTLSAAAGAAAGAATSGALGGGSNGKGSSPTGHVTSTATETDAPSGGSGTRPRTVGGRAFGGPTFANESYVIGERGKPEILTMGNRPGWVTPINSAGGNEVHNHYHMPVHIHAVDAKGIEKSRRQIERQMASSLQNATRAAA